MSLEDAFGNYLNPTDKTRKISDWISANAKSKIEAMNLATMVAYKYHEYASDMEAHGSLEKFAVPDQSLKIGKGDCDDKSSLIVAILNGLPPELRPDEVNVTVGRYFGDVPKPNEYHAYVKARDGNKWFILDGTSGEVHPSPGLRYFDLFSIYSDKITMSEPIGVIAEHLVLLPFLIVNDISSKLR